jgi:hypothetical protein
MLAALSVFGVMLIALTMSWNNNSFGIRKGMVTLLQASTVFFQMSFAAATFFLWDGRQLPIALIDTVLSIHWRMLDRDKCFGKNVYTGKLEEESQDCV